MAKLKKCYRCGGTGKVRVGSKTKTCGTCHGKRRIWSDDHKTFHYSGDMSRCSNCGAKKSQYGYKTCNCADS
ncbi:MAG: hypothetical protein ACTSPQ_22160 [Candidatus Helarchaeota archaeon]